MSDPPVTTGLSNSSGRPYRSPKRAERARRTRHAIREAAATLFMRDGYASTTMKAIAREAGVSEKTMYLAYETKPKLMRHVIQVAVRGDEDRASLSQRPEWRAVFAGPAHEAFARFATINAAVMARTAAIIAVGESAAAGDTELAAHRDQAHQAARDDVRALVAGLRRAGVLAADVADRDAADTIYGLAADENIYLRLTRECGWSEARYADLIARTLQATLGNDPRTSV
ncbi:MAG: TetR/AcrR family transcriptional regulator [Solirubrobacteraceae bacterium]